MSAHVDTNLAQSTFLQQVEMTTVSRADCDAKWKKMIKILLNLTVENFVTETMLCAGTEDGRGICQGDSGGPLVCKEGNKWLQYGISSFVYREGCALGEFTSIFANVVNLLPWIQEHTGS